MDKPASTPGGTPEASQVATSAQNQNERSGHPKLSKTPSMTTLESQYSKQSSATNSLTPSPFGSRDSSPIRPPGRPAGPKLTTSTGARSRKNSIQDLSPSRTPRSSIPGPPAGSRTLSAAPIPTLLPAAQASTSKPDSPQKTPINTEQAQPKDNPRWPISPRLRSPPPQLTKPGISPMRRNDQEPPRIAVQRSSPSPLPEGLATMSESETEDAQLQSGVRTPALGSVSTLETVQEVSQPNSPGEFHAALEMVTEKLSSETTPVPETFEFAENKTLRLKPNLQPVESGSDSGSVRAETRRSSQPAPAPLMARQSSAMSSKQGKGKTPGEGSAQNMIVETETVSSIPQVALAPGSIAQGGNGTLKTKPSTETIKPKKDKKKTSRKQPAVTAGTGETPIPNSNVIHYKLRHHQSMRSVSAATDACVSPTKVSGQGPQADEVVDPRRPTTPGARAASVGFYQMSTLLTRPRPASSKAEIFEAKVASAVDEADDSDSEETFVYDSNPPDGGDRPRRFHSRTPSATSMVSQAERNQMRSIHSVIDPGPPVTVKKNMKFVNTFNSNGADSLTGADDDGKGTGRSNPGSARGTARHHHHIGRWGRNGGNSHPSLFDNESPFPNAARPKLPGNTSRQSSGPPSPRFNSTRGGVTNGKRSMQMSSSYDLDDTTGADDERTPLIGSATRSVRSGRGRRTPAPLRSLESQTYRQKPSYLNRFAACLVVTMMLLLVITGAIGFMFATSQPLTDIELVAIKNVLASDPELMFDLTVRAHNPNIVVVTIDQANLEIFAKSEHAGTDSDWWKMPQQPNRPGLGDGKKDSDVHILDDPPDDPPDDDSAPNMRLGTIVEFDSPLSFEGSFFNKGVSSSTGEVRLHLPGNHSAGGSERWERIIQDEFDLIVKGVVRYSLPLSQRVRSAPISGRTTVKRNSASDPTHPNSTIPL